MHRFSITSVFIFVSLFGVFVSLNAVPYIGHQRYNLGSGYAGCAMVDHRVASYGFPIIYLTREWVPHPRHEGKCPLYLNFSLTALLSNVAATLVGVALGFLMLRFIQIAVPFVQDMSAIDKLLKKR